jgi:hypothetical protein
LKLPASLLAVLVLGACTSPYAGPKMPKGTALPPPEESEPAPDAPAQLSAVTPTRPDAAGYRAPRVLRSNPA